MACMNRTNTHPPIPGLTSDNQTPISEIKISSVMTFSCEVNSQKAAKYAIAASKSFSYYLPKSAQRHLQELLKQLPSAARPIYDEYYRDLKCAKARAPESAIAMTTFIASSLPKIAKKHNAFAREMNKEVVSHEHEGYEPIKFPIVAEPEIDDEATTVANTGKKRKRAPAGSIPLLNRPDKKAKKKPSATLVTIPSSVTTPPLSSPGQINPDDPEPEGSIASTPVPRDVQRTTPGSIRFAGNERSRDSSPLPDVPPSAQLNNEEEPFGQPSVQSNTDKQSLLRDDVSVTPIEEHDGEATSLPLPSTVMPESRDDDPSAVTDEFVAESETCGQTGSKINHHPHI